MRTYFIDIRNRDFSVYGGNALANRAEALRNLTELPQQNIQASMNLWTIGLLILTVFLTTLSLLSFYVTYEFALLLSQEFIFKTLFIVVGNFISGVFGLRFTQFSFYYMYHTIIYRKVFPTYLQMFRSGKLLPGTVISVVPSERDRKESVIYYYFTSPNKLLIEGKYFTSNTPLPSIGDTVTVFYGSDEVHVLI